MAGDQGCVPSTPETPVSIALNGIENMISNISDGVNRVEIRISSIISETNPEVESNAKSSCSEIPLIARLEAMERRLSSIYTHLESLDSRIAL